MTTYTLQIGSGSGDRIRALDHSGQLRASNLAEAVNKAKHVINSRSWRPDTNVVHLLESDGDAQRVVWSRPMIVARDM